MRSLIEPCIIVVVILGWERVCVAVILGWKIEFVIHTWLFEKNHSVEPVLNLMFWLFGQKNNSETHKNELPKKKKKIFYWENLETQQKEFFFFGCIRLYFLGPTIFFFVKKSIQLLNVGPYEFSQYPKYFFLIASLTLFFFFFF